jgi:hypothetical protein
MNTSEMIERFQRFASADLSPLFSNRMHQVSEILLETYTVRIILTRYEYRKDGIDIDIEVSLPSLPATSDVASIQEPIDRVIAALEYLKRLISIGFGLELLREEGILIASAVLSRDTNEYVFRAIEPPD